MRDLWPRFGVDYTGAPRELHALFGREAPCVLEIGFGNGDAYFAEYRVGHDICHADLSLRNQLRQMRIDGLAAQASLFGDFFDGQAPFVHLPG